MAETSYGGILDHILEGFQVIDFGYRYVYVNEAVARQGRSTKKDLIGHTMMEKYPGIDRTPFFTVLRKCMEKREAGSMENEFIFPDRTKAWFELRIEPVPEGVFILSLDITERKGLSQAKNEFVSIASHQLRTPLTTVRWYIDLLQAKSANLNELQKKYLRQLDESNTRMIELVATLLNVSRIETGTLALVSGPCDIPALLDLALKDMAGPIQKKQLAIKKAYASGIPILFGDGKLLEMVIQNILSNAVSYTREKGTIALEVAARGDALEVSISDTGIGIPESARGQVFNKFFRADNAREESPEGSGLGLYIVKSLLEQAGGEIRFASEEGKGTAFTMTLPLSGMRAKAGEKGLA